MKPTRTAARPLALSAAIAAVFILTSTAGIQNTVSAASGTSSEGKRLLADLVTKAKQEGGLDLAIPSSTAKAVPDLIRGFEKRFGLKVKYTADTAGADEVKFAKVQTALRVGATPPLDVVQGAGVDNLALIAAGFAMKIDNWRTLLTEINPLVRSGQVKPEEISPDPFTGYSFMWAERSKALLYNTQHLSKNDLPAGWADLAKARYKGQFPVAPFFDEWESGILVYNRDDWLRIVDQVGKNAAAVLTYSAALDRILAGEFTLGPSNAYYFWSIKARDPKAPLGLHWFSDFTPLSQLFYIVPKGTRHPATATLFALWMTTPEAEGIRQPVDFYSNIVFGQSELDQQARKTVKESGAKLITWFDSPRSRKELAWFGTDEGRAYRAKLAKALTQRK